MPYEFFTKNKDIIDTISNIFVAIGTVGSVITALLLAYKDSKPKLKVYATIGVLYPDDKEYLWMSCTNISKQQIICNGFSFAPRKLGKNRDLRFMIRKPVPHLSSPTPKTLEYSSRIDHWCDLDIFSDNQIKSFLSKHRWIAALQLRRWRVAANTNVKRFEGKLSSGLMKTILEIIFEKK
jgi:hypothetical protein